MSSHMTHDTYSGQLGSLEELSKPVPRPDHFPEDPAKSQSYWIREYPIALDEAEEPTKIPDNVDVVIIGSGITGATALHEISERRPDLRVALFEARGVCTGATGRDGGRIGRPDCYNLVATAQELGVDEAIRLKHAGRQNRTMLIECIQKLGIAEKVDLQLHGTVVVFATEDEKAAYDADVEFAKEHGYIPEGYYLSPGETAKKFDLDPEITAHGSAFIENSGTVYPRKFIDELLKSAMSKMKGLSIHPYTPVEAVTHIPATSEYQVRTARGVVTSRAVFHATNAYAGSICPSLHGADGVFGCKAHMLGVQPNAPGCNTRQLKPGFGYADFWHWILQRPNNGPYLYGLANAELLNDYDDRETLPLDSTVRGDMVGFLEKVFPQSFQNVDSSRDVKYDWTGIQGFTMTGASIVGKVSQESPGEFACVGHNGEGMGRCFLGATVATDAMLAYLKGEAYVVPDSFPKSWRRNM